MITTDIETMEIGNRVMQKVKFLPGEIFLTDGGYLGDKPEHQGSKYFLMLRGVMRIIASAKDLKTLEYHIDEIIKNGYNYNGRVLKTRGVE